MLTSPLLFPSLSAIGEAAVSTRLPSISLFVPFFAEAGGLLAYGPDFPDLFRSAAGYVDKILKGAKPADLPVQRPTRFELIVNVKTANALSLQVPQSLLVTSESCFRCTNDHRQGDEQAGVPALHCRGGRAGPDGGPRPEAGQEPPRRRADDHHAGGGFARRRRLR